MLARMLENAGEHLAEATSANEVRPSIPLRRARDIWQATVSVMTLALKEHDAMPRDPDATPTMTRSASAQFRAATIALQDANKENLP